MQMHTCAASMQAMHFHVVGGPIAYDYLAHSLAACLMQVAPSVVRLSQLSVTGMITVSIDSVSTEVRRVT